jgi:regulator of replication initiation timing
LQNFKRYTEIKNEMIELKAHCAEKVAAVSFQLSDLSNEVKNGALKLQYDAQCMQESERLVQMLLKRVTSLEDAMVKSETERKKLTADLQRVIEDNSRIRLEMQRTTGAVIMPTDAKPTSTSRKTGATGSRSTVETRKRRRVEESSRPFYFRKADDDAEVSGSDSSPDAEAMHSGKEDAFID